MSDWLALIVVACALYFIECLAWIEAVATACFESPLGRGWRCTRGTELPGNERGGLLLVDPLSVRGGLVVCRPWPLSMSPDGLTNVTADGGTGGRVEPHYISFNELESVRAEFGEIHINGKRFVRASSSAVALDLVHQIQHVWRRPMDMRASDIKSVIAGTLDNEGVATTWAAFQRNTRILRACCYSLFAFTFVLSPLVLFFIGPYPAWQYLLLGLIVITLATAVTYFRTHAALYPRCPYDRWIHTLSMILLPVAAIRCVDKLSRDALSRYSVVVVAPTLCGGEAATPALRQHLVDLRNRPDAIEPDESSSPAELCAEWFRQILTSEMEAALGRLKLTVLKPPLPEEETMVSYCPRCHAQFGRAGSGCPGCPGVRLVLFHADERAAVESQRLML